MKPILVLLMLSGIMYAAIWTSGDAGEAWSKEKAQEMCARSDVAAVYICLGNTVDVVWKDESKGSTFYEPEGNVVNCPPVAPAEMGAECMQLMMPNYCTLDDNVCGYVEPEEFPGGEVVEGELIYNGVPVEEEVEEEAVPPSEEPTTPPSGDGGPVVIKEDGTTAPRTVKSAEGEVFDTTILLAIVLGVAVIVLLYFVYKRTTGG